MLNLVMCIIIFGSREQAYIRPIENKGSTDCNERVNSITSDVSKGLPYNTICKCAHAKW